MDKNLKTLAPFREANKGFPFGSSIKEWKMQGGKVVGFFGGDIPEEILSAAGVLPVWLRGPNSEIPLEHANAYLYIYTCSYTRSIFEIALRGDFDYLDGVVSGPFCDGTRRLADVWEKYISPSVIHFLHTPHKSTPEAEEFYYQNILEFTTALEQKFQTSITKESLRNAIKTYNQTRTLWKRLYAIRKAEHPPISGAEVIEIYNASAVMPRERFNVLLEDLVKEAESTDRALNAEVRLLINGTILHNPDYVKGIEALGALVVADSLLSGMMNFTDPIVEDENEEPLLSIAKHYLRKFPSPRMHPGEVRYRRIEELVKEFDVDGVITEVVRYCAPQIYDVVRLERRLKAKDIPCMRLDIEYGTGATGQIKTRVQAFLEMIRERRSQSYG
ncbi:MAG: 2-hydroxyacyl-CoA dehydratase subunit D [Candidatus Hodarchaeota archaeon]